eukprot:TRINITY_DN11976_c0_g1_i2.p1 TRINITY_DN11976_c0_g1~~TRINITY_DN11976_c0_g1_i2.p1  ORF type:complete len:176 (+),score=10.48 TRINITY_DN11976_c0_g1_i2:592-1119(+)
MRYKGNFMNSKQHGYGVESWMNGQVYKGMFKDGKIHGKGFFKWASEATYEGSPLIWFWRGDGRTYQVFDEYKGTKDIGKAIRLRMIGDKMHEKGLYLWPDGAIYDGDILLRESTWTIKSKAMGSICGLTGENMKANRKSSKGSSTGEECLQQVTVYQKKASGMKADVFSLKLTIT